MVRLYFLAGSTHSREAMNLLQQCNIAFTPIDVEAANILAWIDRTHGITLLPAVTDEGDRIICEGIAAIREHYAQLAAPVP